MKKNKTITAAAAALSALLLLAGCGDNPSPPPAQTQTQAQSQTVTENTQSQSETQTQETISADTEASSSTEASAEAVPSDITAEITANVEMSSLAEIGEDRLGNYLEVDMSKVESFSMYICGSGGFADEVAVFALNDESYAETLTNAMKARIDSRSVDFKDYNPDEYDKLQHALLKTKGKYVLMVVSGDNDTAESIFDKYVN